MSIVIRRKNGDIIWFDAITQYDSTYSATVTKHPIASGGFVSDHVTTDNVILNISGIFSDADFNISRPILSGGSLGVPDPRLLDSPYVAGVYEYDSQEYRQKQFQNNTQTVYPVQISEAPSINKLLPEVIAQFTKDSIPMVYVTPQEKAKTARAVKNDLIQMWRGREEFQVLDIVDNSVVEEFSPCIFTNITFREDDTTGEGIFPQMTIEQVVYTELQEISVKIKTSNKGRKTGTVNKKPIDSADGKKPAPENTPIEHTKDSASSLRSPVGQSATQN